MQVQDVVVRFKTPASKTAPAADCPYDEELERFAAADPRWHSAIEMASSRLSRSARCTLGVALSGLEAGPAPRLMPFDFGPDDEDALCREQALMAPMIRSALDLLDSGRIGLARAEITGIKGVVSAVHRLLRIAKTRP